MITSDPGKSILSLASDTKAISNGQDASTAVLSRIHVDLKRKPHLNPINQVISELCWNFETGLNTGLFA